MVAGVIESIVDYNPLYQLLPFDEIDGGAIVYNQEDVIGNVQGLAVGGTITAKDPATSTQRTTKLVTLIGDAEVDQFIQATQSSLVDQTANQVASKAKGLGRLYQQYMATGTDTPTSFAGLRSLVDASKSIDTGVDGEEFSIDILDQLIQEVPDADFFNVGRVGELELRRALRRLPGAGIGDTITLPNGKNVLAYCGVAVLRNDFLTSDETRGATTNTFSIYAGRFDDGSRKVGLAGLTPTRASGIQVSDGGLVDDKNEKRTRLAWYTGLVLFNKNGLVVAPGIRKAV